MDVLLSVVIPTRNRINTTFYCVKQCLAITQSDDIEVIVHDCSDYDTLGSTLNTITDNRLRYFHVDPISMTENWNLALQNVRGEYVIVIGDDDGLLPEIYELCQWARLKNISALGHLTKALFLWPDYPKKELASKLFVYPCNGSLHYYNAKNEFANCISSGYCKNYSILPHLYHGLVKMEFLHEIKKKTGCFVDGTCPDYYAAFALSLTISEYCIVSYPFTYNGACGESNASRGIDNKQLSKHINEYKNFKWPDVLPDGDKNVIVHIAESLYRTLNNFKMLNVLKNYNFPELYASIIVSKQFFQSKNGLLNKYFKLPYRPALVYLFLLLYNICKELFHKTFIKFMILRKKDPVFLIPTKHDMYKANDILEANDILSEHLKKRKISIQNS